MRNTLSLRGIRRASATLSCAAASPYRQHFPFTWSISGTQEIAAGSHTIEISHQPGISAVDQVVGQLYRNRRGVPAHPKLSLVAGKWVDGEGLLPRNS